MHIHLHTLHHQLFILPYLCTLQAGTTTHYPADDDHHTTRTSAISLPCYHSLEFSYSSEARQVIHHFEDPFWCRYMDVFLGTLSAGVGSSVRRGCRVRVCDLILVSSGRFRDLQLRR